MRLIAVRREAITVSTKLWAIAAFSIFKYFANKLERKIRCLKYEAKQQTRNKFEMNDANAY